MNKILIRPKDIKNCWETTDACIVEQYDGKKWVCEKTFYCSEDCEEWNTMFFIREHQSRELIELLLKGKSEENAK